MPASYPAFLIESDKQQSEPGIYALVRNNADLLSFLFAIPDKTADFIRIKTIKAEKEFVSCQKTKHLQKEKSCSR